MNRSLPIDNWRARMLPLALIALVLAAVPGALAGAVRPAAGEVNHEEVKSPKPANERVVFYKLTFAGKFDSDALMSGVSVPSGARFSRVVGATHSSDQAPFTDGGTADTTLETFVENGSNSAAISYKAAMATGRLDAFVLRKTDNGEGIGATETVTAHRLWANRSSDPTEDLGVSGSRADWIVANADNSLLSVAAAVLPSPDWFVGLSDKELRPGGTWIVDETINLYPRDLGTDDGADFDSAAADTDPQGTISSLQNSGQFSDNPIATLRIELLAPPTNIVTRNGDSTGAVDDYNNFVMAKGLDASVKVTWTPLVDFYVDGYKVQWIERGGTFGSTQQAIVEGADSNVYMITGLTNERRYWVRVVPYNAAGDGKPSEVDLTLNLFLSTYSAKASAGNAVLVSNVNEDASRTTDMTFGDPSVEQTQSNGDKFYHEGPAINQFTTGPASAQLGSVTIAQIGPATQGAKIQVHLYSDDQGELGSHLVQFINIHNDDNLIQPRRHTFATFAAPAGQIPTLDANTSYWVMFKYEAGTAAVKVLKEDGEDAVTRPGWSIGDACQRWTGSPTDGSYVDCPLSTAFWMSLNEPSTDQLAPVATIEGGSAVEGNAIEFTVSLSDAVDEEIIVKYRTVDGSATTADSDYTAVPATTLTFAANETEKTFTIATGDDSTDEENESFTVRLSDPKGAILGPIATGSGLIINNDETSTTDATVSSISLVDEDGRTIALNETFDRYQLEYTATADKEGETVHGTVTFRTGVPPDSVMYLYEDGTDANGDTVSTEYDADYQIRSGVTTIKFMVTSNDGNRVNIYKVNIRKPASTDSSLSALSLGPVHIAA
ncbi:MAG: spondin domain-containing protein [Chloroflexi bacterium]|nr:spondin domain-containing protein [Chloroflexota bacterium]